MLISENYKKNFLQQSKVLFSSMFTRVWSGVGGFRKILRKDWGGWLRNLFFLTRVGRWSENGQNLPYVISEQSLTLGLN